MFALLSRDLLALNPKICFVQKDYFVLRLENRGAGMTLERQLTASPKKVMHAGNLSFFKRVFLKVFINGFTGSK